MKTTLLKRLMVVAVGGLFVACCREHAAGRPRRGSRTGRRACGPPRAAGGGGGMPQGGRGPIKVMVVTKGHNYEREPFFQMWDSWGSDITWSHVEHPAADVMLSPKYSKLFDVYAFFDLGGPGIGSRAGPAATGGSARIVQDGEQPVLSAAVRAVQDRVPEAAARGQRVRLPASCVRGMAAYLARILGGHRRRVRLVCAQPRARHRPSESRLLRHDAAVHLVRRQEPSDHQRARRRVLRDRRGVCVPLVRRLGASARAHRLPAGGSDEEPEPEGEVQQSRRVGEGGREQPGVLHAGWPWLHRVGGRRRTGSWSATPSSGPRRPRRWPGRRRTRSGSSIRQIKVGRRS